MRDLPLSSTHYPSFSGRSGVWEWTSLRIRVYMRMRAFARSIYIICVRPFEYPIPPGRCPENLPAHILSLKSPFLCLISEFCNLHGPKNSVKERFFQLFYTVFLRMAVFRRTFALAIGTQAPPALLDTPLGESAVGGGSPAAGLQRYLKWFHNSFVERSTRNRNKTRDRQVSDDLESLGKCFAYRSISLTGIRLGAGSYDALSSKKRIYRKEYIYNEEFDPGSGWTLATGLTHASRGAAWLKLASVDGDRRTGA